MKDSVKLLEYVLKTVKNGDIKVVAQEGKIVKVQFRVCDKENILTLADLERSPD